VSVLIDRMSHKYDCADKFSKTPLDQLCYPKHQVGCGLELHHVEPEEVKTLICSLQARKQDTDFCLEYSR
jgi:hypothetical protein